MVSSDLGACEWFVWDLRRSGLIERGHLDQVVGEFLKRNPRAEPPALAEYLVGQGVISGFQAERILQGKTQGLVLGPYVLIDSIGQGSMGQVYKASSKTDTNIYAVKVLPRRSMWNVRLARRQVRSFSQFTHQAVVPFVDVGTSGGQHYLVWPMVEGESLEAKIVREGALPMEVAAQIALQVAQGLAQSHSQGLFHGLLKPSNIMIGKDGQTKILDFGIGSLLVENEGESLVDTMSTANTLTSGLDCASPESIMEPTNRTTTGDQYSLGCILYCMLAGRYPFPDGTAVEKMMAHQFKQPPSIRDLVPGIPEGLAAIVERLMQKSPESRYAGADEIVEALQPYAQEVRRGSSHGNLRTSPGASIGGGRKSQIVLPPVVQPMQSPMAPTAVGKVTPTNPIPAPMPTFSTGMPPAPVPIQAVPPTPAPRSMPAVSRSSLQNVQIPQFSAPEPVSYANPGFAPTPIPASNLQVPQVVQSAPVANTTRTSANWAERPKSSKLTLLLIFLLCAGVMFIVYQMGKEYINFN